jgi:hypothetical protein
VEPDPTRVRNAHALRISSTPLARDRALGVGGAAATPEMSPGLPLPLGMLAARPSRDLQGRVPRLPPLPQQQSRPQSSPM